MRLAGFSGAGSASCDGFSSPEFWRISFGGDGTPGGVSRGGLGWGLRRMADEVKLRTGVMAARRERAMADRRRNMLGIVKWEWVIFLVVEVQ